MDLQDMTIEQIKAVLGILDDQGDIPEEAPETTEKIESI